VSSHALVIGIDGYSDGWSKLAQARSDAVAVADELKRHGFQVTLRTDRDARLDKRALEVLIDDFVYGPGTDPNARLLIWFAGHGHTIDGEGYLVPQGARNPAVVPAHERPVVEAEFRRSALSLRRFGEYMRETKARHVLSIFDSCFGGTVFETTRAAAGFDINQSTVARVRQFISSGDAQQEVSDDGLFRRLFVDALRGLEPEADENKDGYITGTELGRFLTYKITSYKKTVQTPRYGRLREPDFDKGEFLFRVVSQPSIRPPVVSDATEPKKAEVARAGPPPRTKLEFNRPDGETIRVLFATQRLRTSDRTSITFGAERSRALTLGRTSISWPKKGSTAEASRASFTLQGIALQEHDEFLESIPRELARSENAKGQILVYIHGFSVTFESALYRTAQIAYDTGFDGLPVLFSWPSRGGMTQYAYDIEAAAQSAAYFEQFLDWLGQQPDIRIIHLISHSLGSAPLLASLERIVHSDTPAAKKIGEVILVAPDIDRDLAARRLGDVARFTRGVTLYASGSDSETVALRPFFGGAARAGDVPASGPLIVAGVDTIDVTQQATDFLSLNHSTYAERASLLNDVALLLRTGRRPPDRRIPILERVSAQNGIYWRYPR